MSTIYTYTSAEMKLADFWPSLHSS